MIYTFHTALPFSFGATHNCMHAECPAFANTVEAAKFFEINEDKGTAMKLE